MTTRWKKRPEGSTWGDWGADDQLGRLNLVDRSKVLQGMAEVKEGRTFCLSLPLDLPGGNVLSPVRFPPVLRPVIRNNEPYFNYEWRKQDPRLNDIAADDAVLLHTQYSTQWDALAHRGARFDVMDNGEALPVYYNGFRAGEHLELRADGTSKAHRLGVEHMAAHGVQGRGVLVDLFSHCGTTPREEVGYERLMRIMEADAVEVEQGDMLCLWTGLDRMVVDMDGRPNDSLKHSCAVLDGRDERLLKWISDSGVAVIASDNLAVEAVGKPLPEGATSTLPLHEHCLFKLGVHLGELWYLADLAQWLKANARSRFLLTAPPLRLPGAVGSPLTPIATV